MDEWAGFDIYIYIERESVCVCLTLTTFNVAPPIMFIVEMIEMVFLVENMFETFDNMFETFDNMLETFDNMFETFDNMFETFDNMFETVENMFQTVEFLSDTDVNMFETFCRTYKQSIGNNKTNKTLLYGIVNILRFYFNHFIITKTRTFQI